jgi:hypothetical protein
MELVFRENVGWFDPRETYCANSCGRPAVGERPIGIYMDEYAEDGFWEQSELLCAVCLTQEELIT